MSDLSDALARYVTMRRGFGYKFISQERLLLDFIAFIEAEGATVVTSKLALAWATGAAGRASWPSRLAAVRGFARHLACTQPRTEIPPAGIVRPPPRHRPHIYTGPEIRGLLDAMLALPPASGLRRWTYSCLFGLLAVTGLRVGEALRLKRGDVDLDAGVLTVRDTKFGKARIVPIHSSTVDVLTDYAQRRDAEQSRAGSTHFFTGERGGRLHYQNFHFVFCEQSRQLGLRSWGRGGPRIHDLRHTYAVGTLLCWYRSGQDVDRLMPVLSTFLGHSHTRDTYWYLSACPELMEHAAQRLEARWEHVS